MFRHAQPLEVRPPDAREQRCWVHKTANVLNKLPKSVQPRAKQHLQDIWMAEKAFDFFLEAYGPKYDKAVACGPVGRPPNHVRRYYANFSYQPGFPMWHPSAKLRVARNRSKGKSDGL